MVKKSDVLQFIADNSCKGRQASSDDIAVAFGLSPEAACRHLSRLWRDRLVIASTSGEKRSNFRLEPGESMMHFRFYLTRRGRDRLRWYQRHY